MGYISITWTLPVATASWKVSPWRLPVKRRQGEACISEYSGFPWPAHPRILASSFPPSTLLRPLRL